MTEDKSVMLEDHGIIVRQGHPDNPYLGQLLSEEDEKRLDEKGREVVRGLPWSAAGTGVYLAVAVSHGPIGASRPVVGGTSLQLDARLTSGADVRVFVGTFMGKPAFNIKTAGACLELPVDLGRDDIKRKYVTEWLAHTAVEGLQLAGVGFDLHHETLGELYLKLAMSCALAAEDAIKETGL